MTHSWSCDVYSMGHRALAFTTAIPPRRFFFFSSRRRHTRSLCDWSSDVCSSDLILLQFDGLRPVQLRILVIGIVRQRSIESRNRSIEILLLECGYAAAILDVGRLGQIGRASCRERV